jgi:hypothetical protein
LWISGILFYIIWIIILRRVINKCISRILLLLLSRRRSRIKLCLIIVYHLFLFLNLVFDNFNLAFKRGRFFFLDLILEWISIQIRLSNILIKWVLIYLINLLLLLLLLGCLILYLFNLLLWLVIILWLKLILSLNFFNYHRRL